MFWAIRAVYFANSLSCCLTDALKQTRAKDRKRKKRKLEFEGRPSFNNFGEWKMHFRRSRKEEGKRNWESKVLGMIVKFQTNHGDFETLDSKFTNGLMKILHKDFRKRAVKEEVKYSKIVGS